MNRKLYILVIVSILSLFLVSCQEDIRKKEAYRKGKLTIAIDPSFLNLGTALVEVFNFSFPEADITFKSEVEDLVIADFVNGISTMAIVSRDLTKEEAEILLSKTRIKYIPSRIACDATIFITAKNSPIDKVSLSDIKLKVLEPDSKFIFDNGNSSNFNNVMRRLELAVNRGHKVTALPSAKEVIHFVESNKSYIGIIGLDVLSDNNDPKVKELLTKIKIIPVVSDKQEVIEPSIPNLREGRYPFTKRVYLLNAEPGFLIGSSFARFIGSQRGQLIVTRSGLQPYYLYERNVQIN